MKKFLVATILFCSMSLNVFAQGTQNISANDALIKLKKGNENFAHMHLHHPDVSFKRLHSLEKGQHPFVAVLSCSDSRVPPEIIFDQGLGDIFEVRNAGNVVDDHVIGSIEYAVSHLGVNLVVVMGHTDCGAVKAALDCHNNNETKYLKSLTEAIVPSVHMAENQKGCLLDNAIKNNVYASVKSIVESDTVIADCVKNKGVKILPAIYDLHTGKVKFLN